MNMVEQIRREVDRKLSSVRQALRGIKKSGLLNTRVQRISGEGLAGEPLPNMELLQQFGFSSGVPDGAQLVVIPLGGRTSAAVVVATEHGAYRFQVDADGEAAMYNQWGDVIHAKQDRSIHVSAALKVVLDTPLVETTGDLHVGGNVVADGEVSDQGGDKSMSGMRSVFNGHTQPVSSGTAQAPTGSM